MLPRRLRCPAPGCDWSVQSRLDPDMLPVNCPKCGCPIFHFEDEPEAPRAPEMPKWKVYRLDKPELFAVVEWPSYEPMEIKAESVRLGKFTWGDTPSQRVRRHED